MTRKEGSSSCFQTEEGTGKVGKFVYLTVGDPWSREPSPVLEGTRLCLPGTEFLEPQESPFSVPGSTQ